MACDAAAAWEIAAGPGLVAWESVGLFEKTADWSFAADEASVNGQHRSAAWHSAAWLVVEALATAVAGVAVDALVTA